MMEALKSFSFSDVKAKRIMTIVRKCTGIWGAKMCCLNQSGEKDRPLQKSKKPTRRSVI